MATSWPPAGKELFPWLSALAVFISCHLGCVCSFPTGCLGQDVEFDCIGSYLCIFIYLTFYQIECNRNQGPYETYILFFSRNPAREGGGTQTFPGKACASAISEKTPFLGGLQVGKKKKKI